MVQLWSRVSTARHLVQELSPPPKTSCAKSGMLSLVSTEDKAKTSQNIAERSANISILEDDNSFTRLKITRRGHL